MWYFFFAKTEKLLNFLFHISKSLNKELIESYNNEMLGKLSQFAMK